MSISLGVDPAIIATREVEAACLAGEVADLVAAGCRLLTIVGTDERASRGGFGLWVALLTPDGAIRQLRAALDPADPRYPAITLQAPAAHWDEREAADLLGFVPEGHPDPRRLILREDWPRGLYPLRKDFDPSRVPPPARHETFPFVPFAGDEIGHIPVGPIHAGIIEPGHFRFSAVGETVLYLEARLFYTHRGIEKLVEGRTPEEALPLVERICGVCAFSHSLAFCEAVEALAGVEVTERASWARTLCLELERLYNHLGDAGNICAGTGFAVGAMRGARLKEEVQRLIDDLVGHRFLRDVGAVGGLRRDLPKDALDRLRAAAPHARAESRDLAALLRDTDSFVERTRGTGVVLAETVRALGGVGVAARAAGVPTDLRRERPNPWYRRFPPRLIAGQTGDVAARLAVRLDEIDESWRLVEELLASEPSGPVRVPVELPGTRAVGIGAVESPRGADVHWLALDSAGRIDRLRVRSASFANWPLVAAAGPGNLVPDFPLINKSFELCYACLDR
jgi:Ni,Fe-hydrogenase III large subunit/Ni,Fe-hydrogenase III component G